MRVRSSQKIGVLGGCFNPVHVGHLVLAQDAMDIFDLDKIVFVPCAAPPHRKSSAPVAPKHRLAMLEAAVEDNLCFETSDIEIRRGGVSYAIDTMSYLKQQDPDSNLFFVIGTDTLLELHTWKKIYELLELCEFVSISRPGRNAESMKPADLKLNAPWPERLLANTADGHGLDISSSDIRHRIAEGMNIRYLVPHPVEMYIAEHNLYTI